MALPLLEIEKELAKRRHGRKSAEKSADSGRATEIVAERIGVSHDLLEQALWLRENAPEEEIKKLREGEAKISSVYKKHRKKEKVQELKELARRRQIELGKTHGGPLDQKFGQGGRTLEIVAKKIGVSDELLRQPLWLRENAPEERVAIGMALEEREKEKARERKARPGLPRSEKFTEQGDKGEALEKVARAVGWSRPQGGNPCSTVGFLLLL